MKFDDLLQEYQNLQLDINNITSKMNKIENDILEYCLFDIHSIGKIMASIMMILEGKKYVYLRLDKDKGSCITKEDQPLDPLETIYLIPNENNKILFNIFSNNYESFFHFDYLQDYIRYAVAYKIENDKYDLTERNKK